MDVRTKLSVLENIAKTEVDLETLRKITEQGCGLAKAVVILAEDESARLRDEVGRLKKVLEKTIRILNENKLSRKEIVEYLRNNLPLI